MVYESGAISPNDLRCITKAEELYAQIRRRKYDYKNVATHTGYSFEQCRIVKNYIFYDEHELLEGYIRFTPDISMAQSWLRLSEKNGRIILPHDKVLLQHELTEIMYLLRYSNITQLEAHRQAEKQYNYSQATREYYASKGIYY